MPRKTKDVNEEEIKLNKKTSKVKTESAVEEKPKKAATKKASSTTKKTTKTTKTKAEPEAKEEKPKKTAAKKTTSKKATSTTKKITKTTKTKAEPEVKEEKPKKTAAKKTTTKKTTRTRKAVKKSEEISSVEYYDLPSYYDQTVVKILAQTPTTLFVYWELSSGDVERFKSIYGEDFFYTTKPILIVHNDTMNYSFEVEINDFANNWYLHVDDAKCDYRIELGRKPISHENIKDDYIYISSSNEIESPNDKILFDSINKIAFFRNVKTNVESQKNISSISFMKRIGKIYNIYDLYKKMYNEDIDKLYDLSNPGSGNPSSK